MVARTTKPKVTAAKAKTPVKAKVVKPAPVTAPTEETAVVKVAVPKVRRARVTGLRLKMSYADKRGTGQEPEWDNVAKLTPEQIKKQWSNGQYYYYVHHKIKEMRPFIIEVLGKNWTAEELKDFNKLKDWMVGSQLGPQCVMVYKGAPWPSDAILQQAKDRLAAAIVRSKLAGGAEIEYEETGEEDENGEKILREVVVEGEAVARPVTIRDRIVDMRNDIVGGLEELEDQITKTSKSLPTNSIMMYLRSNNCPQQIIPYMETMYQGRLAFMQEVKAGKDKDLIEAYSTYSKKTIDLWIQWYTMIVTDLADFKRAKIATRKVRIRKPPAPEKITRRLKYLKDFPELGLTSIKATEVVHATQLWVYNTKTRKLGVYNASDMDKELTVKGSTIIGWDPKTSVAKTLRKPAEQLKAFNASGKVQLRTFLEKIKATEIKLTGRINEQVLLLKASR